MKKNSETLLFIQKQDSLLANFIEPALDQAISQLKIDLPLAGPLRKLPKENEIKDAFRAFLTEQIYSNQERRLVMRGFDLIIENLHHISGGEHLKNDLIEIGNKLINLSNDMIANESLSDMIAHPLIKQKNRSESQDSHEAVHHFLDYYQQSFDQVIPFSLISSISDIGIKLFDEQRIADSAAVYEFLSMLAPTSHETWFSLALCHHRLHDYPQAIAGYIMSILTDALDIQSFINLMLCYKSVHDLESFAQAFILANSLINHAPLSQDQKSSWRQALVTLNEMES